MYGYIFELQKKKIKSTLWLCDRLQNKQALNSGLGLGLGLGLGPLKAQWAQAIVDINRLGLFLAMPGLWIGIVHVQVYLPNHTQGLLSLELSPYLDRKTLWPHCLFFQLFFLPPFCFWSMEGHLKASLKVASNVWKLKTRTRLEIPSKREIWLNKNTEKNELLDSKSCWVESTWIDSPERY